LWQLKYMQCSSRWLILFLWQISMKPEITYHVADLRVKLSGAIYSEGSQIVRHPFFFFFYCCVFGS
jgi:protein-S-isoprenylcysteine O-methyltransferase Ste14